MKTLLLLRHAKSSWKNPDLTDHDRPLNKRGKNEAPRIGKLLRKEGLVPDVVISSTAQRARDTAELVVEAAKLELTVRVIGDLYPGAPADYVRVLSALGPQPRSVLAVGHNPGLEHLLSSLVGEVKTLSTAALARVELPINDWGEFSASTRGRLAGMWRAKEL